MRFEIILIIVNSVPLSLSFSLALSLQRNNKIFTIIAIYKVLQTQFFID